VSSQRIGRDITTAMGSGERRAICFGTISKTDGVRCRGVESEQLDPLGGRLAELLARESAGKDRDQRDPALDRRQEAAGVAGKLQRALGATAAALGHCLQARLAGRHDRQLTHREHAVQRDHREDEEDVEPGYGG
jgi:hypothetical protein